MIRIQSGVVMVGALLSVTAFAVTDAAAKEAHVTGSGVAKTEARPVSDIRKVSVGNVGILTVEVGDTESLTVEADDNLLAYIETVDNGETLKIGLKGGVSYDTKTPIRYRLRVKSLDSLTLSGATEAKVKALPPVSTFTLSLSGATQVHFDSMSAGTLTVGVSGASRIIIDAGKTKTQTLDLSGTSQYKAFALQSETATVDASGTSNVELTATHLLRVDASGMTRVNYKGNPPEVKSNTSGMSSVKPSAK